MKGIDVSVWQQNIDYEKLKSDGIEFAIIRCGYGKNSYQKDKMFETHFQGFKKAGIKIGVYLYSYVNSLENALKEAENCLNFIRGKTLDLPVFYDLEEKATKMMGKNNITECALVFCNEIKKAGYNSGVYANLDWFNNYIDVNKLINNGFKIWLAQWSNKMTANFKVDYWQYTSKGQVSGIKGNVDLNYCYDISKTVENVNNSVEKSKYVVGKNYITQVDLNVRIGAGLNYEVKNYNDLTEDGKKHAYKLQKAILRKGTTVTCQKVVQSGENIWIKIPSRIYCRLF